jgi:hypothetical protein
MNKSFKFFYLVPFILLFSCSNKLYQSRIVLLPDTQYYAEKYPEVLDSQINWIVRNAREIDFVIQQGDLTQNNNDKEWEIVQKAFSRLNNLLPYVLAVGNHDMGSMPGKFADTRNTTLYNKYFPYQQMAQLPGFGGVFENGKTDNAYYLMQKGKQKWLVLTLEFGPRNAVLEWANDIVQRHRDRTVIVNTHSYMYSDSTRQGPGDNWRPQAYGIGKDSLSDVNDGEQIWNKLIRKHPNIRFVFSGHVLNSGVGTLISVNDHGNYVYQMLANYQSETKNPNGGNGWLRILDMDMRKKTLSVKTYSPYVNDFKSDTAHQFVINNMIF